MFIVILVARALASNEAAPPAHAALKVARAHDARTIDAQLLPSGLALPYPTRRVFRGFGPCLASDRGSAKHYHEALDLGGVGPNGGLGTAVRSMTRARVTRVGRASERPDEYGTPDLGDGVVVRGGRSYPRTAEVAGYGLVAYFSRAQGSWRSGNIVETVALGGALDGHRIRYMHLAAVRPDLASGDMLEPGEELGLLGGTGVMESSPHLHVDVRDADDHAVDIGPWLGLPPTATCGAVAVAASGRAAASDFSDARWHPRTWLPPAGANPDSARHARRRAAPIDLGAPPSPYLGALAATPAPVVPVGRVNEKNLDVPDCGATTIDDDFATGVFEAHAYRTRLARGRWIELSLSAQPSASWPATLELYDRATGRPLAPGVSDALVLTSLPAASGAPPRLRVVVVKAVDLLLAVRAPAAPDHTAGAYRLRLVEKCKVTDPH